MSFVLLYQVGIANLFRNGKLLFQGTYSRAEDMARGAKLAGADVDVMHWDGAGDALLFRDAWTDGPGDLWEGHKYFGGLWEA